MNLINMSSVKPKFCWILEALFPSTALEKLLAQIRLRLFVAFCLVVFSHIALSTENQRLLLLTEYISVDYPEAVQDGVIINEAEYQEMVEFSNQVNVLISALPENNGKPLLLDDSNSLKLAILGKKEPKAIRALTTRLVENLIDFYDILSLPITPPNLDRAETLYVENCTSCHGQGGMGAGPASRGLDPQPTNFSDKNRALDRSISGLFNAITVGVDGTSMFSFSHLSTADRWSLAFYVSNFSSKLERDKIEPRNIATIRDLVSITPRNARAEWGADGVNELVWLRQNPNSLFAEKPNPILHADRQLAAALDAYRSGNIDHAYQLALNGYLEGYELIEATLATRDQTLAAEIERDMLALRADLTAGSPVEKIEAKIGSLREKLQAAQQLIDNRSLSFATAFVSALVILLREGLEAILIVLALVMFVRKSDGSRGVVHIHLGWISALLAGVATWWISSSMLKISGASRELTEGFAALSASAILLYVGFWMHNKSSAGNWQLYLKTHAERVVSSGALWGMGGLAFVAVYREVFETVLFYQALWLQVTQEVKPAVVYGFAAGCLVLVSVGFAMVKYAKKLPITEFFRLSAILMFILAFILAGKGMIALVEAGVLDSHPVPFLRVDALGIHPYLESLVVQLLILIIGLVYWLRTRSRTTEAINVESS